MKKLTSIALALCLTTALGTTAFAHGHHNRTQTQQYEVCPYEDCYTTGVHTHDDYTYCSHYNGDGHDYHGCYNGGNYNGRGHCH